MRTTVYIDSKAPFLFRGINWGDEQSQDPDTKKYSDGTFWSTKDQDSISFDIQAANIDVYGSKAFNHGNYEAKVYVPNTLQNPGVTEVFSGTTTDREFQKLIYSYDFAAGDQDKSVNKIRLSNKGSAGQYLDLDYIVATIKVGADEEQIQTKQYDSGDGAVKYSGSWQKGTIPNRSSMWTKTPGDSMTLSFKGSSIAAFGTTDQQHGLYKVSLDGAPDILYNGTSSNLEFDAMHFIAAQLDQFKPHTLKVTNAGTGDKSLLEMLYFVVNSTDAAAPAVPVAAAPASSSASKASSSSASFTSSAAAETSTPTIITNSTANATAVSNGAGAIVSASASAINTTSSIVTEVETSVVETNGALQTITKIRTHAPTQTPPSTGKEAANSGSDSSDSTRTGAIVGGALGAVVISGIIIVLLICLRRKRRRERTERRVYGAGSTTRGTSSFVEYGESPTSDFGLGRGGKFGISGGSSSEKADDQIFLPYLGGLKSRQGTPSPSSRAGTPQFYPFIAGGSTTTSLPREFVTGERFTPTMDLNRATPVEEDGRQSLTSSQGRELIGATIQSAQRRSVHALGERPNLRLDPLNSTFVSTSTSSSRSQQARSAYPSSSTSPVLERNRPLSDNSELDIEDKLNRFTASALMSPAARSSYLTSKYQDALHPFGANAGASSSSAWSSSNPTPTATPYSNKRADSGPLSAVSSVSPLSFPSLPARESDATLVSIGATNGASTRAPNTPKVPAMPAVPEVYRSASTSRSAEPPSSARLRKLTEAEQLVRGVGVGGHDGLESDDEEGEEGRRTRPPGYYSRHFPSPD